jgi:hypothetical protein
MGPVLCMPPDEFGLTRSESGVDSAFTASVLRLIRLSAVMTRPAGTRSQCAFCPAAAARTSLQYPTAVQLHILGVSDRTGSPYSCFFFTPRLVFQAAMCAFQVLAISIRMNIKPSLPHRLIKTQNTPKDIGASGKRMSQSCQTWVTAQAQKGCEQGSDGPGNRNPKGRIVSVFHWLRTGNSPDNALRDALSECWRANKSTRVKRLD